MENNVTVFINVEVSTSVTINFSPCIALACFLYMMSVPPMVPCRPVGGLQKNTKTALFCSH